MNSRVNSLENSVGNSGIDRVTALAYNNDVTNSNNQEAVMDNIILGLLLLSDRTILFLHAAFVNHQMFRTQIDYFESRYNILAVDIIGHGLSSHTRKGDCIDKMSTWINEIM